MESLFYHEGKRVNYAGLSDQEKETVKKEKAKLAKELYSKLKNEKTPQIIDNGDGTYDIQLDIIGKQLVKEERKGANVLLIFDRTSSMTSDMANAPGDGHRIDAAREAVHTLVDTLKPGTNPVEISVFSFARFADPLGGPDNYDQIAGIDWTETGSSITA